MIVSSKIMKQVDHATNECTAGPNHLGSVVLMANKRLELSFGTPAIGRPVVREVEEGRQFVIRQAGKMVDRIKLNALGDHASGGANLLGGVER